MTPEDKSRRIRAVIGNMTLEEKTSLLGCGKNLETAAIERLKIPPVKLPYELNPFSPRSLTCDRPPFLALGCAFDPALTAEYGMIRGAEAAACGEVAGGVVPLGVTRDPTESGAENFFGEDPDLTAENALAYVSKSPLKMLGGNIFGPGAADRRVDERALCEIYLKPASVAGKSLFGLTVPAGRINGEDAASSKRFVSKLLSYSDGLLVNQFGSAADLSGAAEAGAAFGIAERNGIDAIYSAVSDGRLFEKKLDAAVEKIVSAVWDYNLFVKEERDAVVMPSSEDIIDAEFRLASESAVLLKNENGALPLVSERAAVLGPKIKDKPADYFFIGKSGLGKRALAALSGYEKAVAVLCLTDGKYKPGQLEAVNQAIAAKKRLIVLLISPRPVELPFLKDAEALLYLPYVNSGTRGAAERILKGEISPSGRLSVSWAPFGEYPKRAHSLTAGRDMFCYESVYNGYRYFANFKSRLYFPFCHGLSYLKTAYSDLKAAETADGGVEISFTVTNLSDFSGEVTVPVFVGLFGGKVYGMAEKYACCKRVKLEAKGSARVTAAAPRSVFEIFCPASEKFVVCGGKYTVRLGPLSDVFLTVGMKTGKKVRLAGLGETDLPSYYRTGGPFVPLGSDIEKLLKERVMAPEESAIRLSGKPLKTAVKLLRGAYKAQIKAAYRAAVKRSRDSSGLRIKDNVMTRFENAAKALSPNAVQSLIRG